MKTLKTVLHKYSLDIDKPEDLKKYKELRKTLKAQGLKVMESWSGSINNDSSFQRSLVAGAVELETEHLFENQWNSTCGKRLIDWHQQYLPENKHYKTGYWLEQTKGMKQIRLDVHKCGYCGKHYFKPDQVFCSACLDSEYLKKKELYLLRLLPVSKDKWTIKLPQLTDDEKTTLEPAYIKRQTEGDDSRAVKKRAKQRQDNEDKHTSAMAEAETEYKGFEWLMDHNVNIDNCIYYSHSNTFSFGWRSEVCFEVEQALLEVLERGADEFPFAFEIKVK